LIHMFVHFNHQAFEDKTSETISNHGHWSIPKSFIPIKYFKILMVMYMYK
jgi:hypothetical protein